MDFDRYNPIESSSSMRGDFDLFRLVKNVILTNKENLKL
jgi:hypothetical protein